MSKKEVVKASGAIQMTNKISLLQRRTWNILLANAFDELLENEEHKIELKQLTNILNFGSKNEEHLRSSLKDLTTTAVEWNILRKDKSSIWGVTTLLSQVEIKDGICSYAYSPALKKKLFQPSMYAKINLSIQNRFDSKHSLALYELCVDYYDVKRRKGETPFISIEDFRHLMGIEAHEYAEFKYLNKRTIVEPIVEINDKSDIFVEVEYKRLGRKVSAVKFMIKSHSVNKSESGKVKSLSSDSLKSQQDLLNHTDDMNNPLHFLTFYRVSFNDIDYFMRHIPFDVLLPTIQTIKEKIKSGVIHYPKAYILTTLTSLSTEGSKEPLSPPSDHLYKESKDYSKNTLPHYLHFLLEYDLLDTKKGVLEFDKDEESFTINQLLEYSEEFWERLLKRFLQLKEPDVKSRFFIAFEECRLEEDFIFHPVYQALLEAVESKNNFTTQKLYYLSLIIRLYWKILNKEINLEDALFQIMNHSENHKSQSD